MRAWCCAMRRAPRCCIADVPRIVIDDAFESLLDAGDFTAVEADPGEPALFLYTSGSTGRPKGVVLSHQSHLWVLAMRATPAPPPGQRVLVAAPLYHMNALSMCQVTLNNGGTIVLLPSFTPPRLHRCRVALSGRMR